MNIAIIGAGPIGCYAGYLLAKHGHTVSIYENHAQIGLPIQCTGLLTADFDEFNLPKESFLVNTFSAVEVHSPAHTLAVPQKEYLVCRQKFDNFFGNLAQKAGATVYLNHSFQRRDGNNLVIYDSNSKAEKIVNPDVVIAADGPLSPTAKVYGFYHDQRENYYGIQATVEGKFNEKTYTVYFGNKICPDLFGWVVPESSTIARVGLAMRKNSKQYFDTFIKEHNFKALEIQAGTIPVYHPKQKLRKENCYVLGDAASFVKATTLGGLNPGLKQAEILADCINNGKDYEKEVKKLARKLWIHRQLRKMFDKFSDHDWDRMVQYMNKPGIQATLQKYTRENPLPILVQSLLQEPRFLYFGKYLL